MVKLSESRGKIGEGFERIFGNAGMAVVLSKIQSSIIRSGFELESMIAEAIEPERITTLEQLAEVEQDPRLLPPIQVVLKPSKPDPDDPQRSVEADFLIVNNTRRVFMLVEVKDGYVFDTKKSDGELASLRSITSWLAQEFPYRAEYYLCSFNQEDKNEIYRGTKKRFSPEHILTGREFCAVIGIDYVALCARRQQDQKENRRYFFKELLKIPEIRYEVVELLAEVGNEGIEDD